MAKSEQKKARQAQAAKRRKHKKIIIAVVGLVITVTAVVFLVVHIQGRTRVFSDGYQLVNLRSNGTFSARLYHTTRSGTYTETPEGNSNASTIVFSYDGAFAYSRLVNNVLLLPNEWDDFHGHNMRLPRIRR